MNYFKSAVLCLLVGLSSVACAAGSNTKQEGGKVEHLNYSEFNKKVADVSQSNWKYLGDKPCIVDFYASWCGPCKMISPYLDDLAKEYKGKISIYKIDVDKERELARMFGASSIPLLVFIPKDGQPQMSRGAMSKGELRNAIETVLLNSKKK